MRSIKSKLFVIFIFALALGADVNLYGDTADELFKSGNVHYGNGEYELAIEDYRTVIDNGYESFELFYNLGNAYFRINQIGKSILYYEKAKKLEPDDEDVIQNLNIAKLRTIDKIEEIDSFFVYEILSGISNSLGLGIWTFLSLLFVWLSLVIGVLFVMTKSASGKKSLFLVTLIGVIITVFSYYFASVSYGEKTDDSGAILMQASVYVKSSPDNSGTDLFILHEGAKLRISDLKNGWANIKLSNGKTGWVPLGSIERI